VGSLELLEGTGGIIYMASVKNILEIYKKDVTFRVQTPNSLNPEQKKPEMPFTTSPAARVGSTNPFVARIFAQAHDMLKSLPLLEHIDREYFLFEMYNCKEKGVSCQNIFERFKQDYSIVEDKIKSGEIKRIGEALYPFPSIENLNWYASSYLTDAKHALQCMARIYGHCFKSDITGPRFDLIIKHAKDNLPKEVNFISFLEATQGNILDIIELRNGQEHPRPDKATIIGNISYSPEGIVPPVWQITGTPKRPILQCMEAFTDFILSFCEAFFLFCYAASVRPPLVAIIREIPKDQINPDLPIRYKLEPGFIKTEPDKN